MRKITRNNGRLASRSIAAGLVLLLVLVGWPPAAAAQMTKSDWSKVQAVKPGVPITVLLYQDQAPRGNRKVKGRFQSATDDSLTLKMEYGPTRTLPKSVVRGVLVHLSRGVKLNWPGVQAVTPGTRTKVVLYKDQAPRGRRKLKGRFQSATEDSLTLKMEYGPTRTLPKSAVRKVLVHRPLGKRYAVWITPLVSTVIAGPGIIQADDYTVLGKALLAGIWIGIPTGLAFLATPGMVEIHNVPLKHRTQPPAAKPSGAEGKAPGKQKQS